MTTIQQSRYDALLRRVADLKGQGSMVHDALGELFPTIDVENTPSELLYLMGTRMAMGGEEITAGVGFFPRIQLLNPVGSGFLMTITDIITSGNIIQTYHATTTLSILATAPLGVTGFLDTRGGVEVPVGQIRTSTTAATGTVGRWRFRLLSAADLHEVNPKGIAVLSPGAAYEVGGQTTNQVQRTAFRWRERVAEPSELNF